VPSSVDAEPVEDHLRADLPLAALKMAISAQRPGPGLVHHSARGVQYASADYRKMIQSAGLRASMTRKGNCYDNAPIESFFHTLKTELVHHRTMQHGTKPDVISLPISKASIIVSIAITQLSLLFGVLFILSGPNLWAVILCHGGYDTVAFVRFASGKSRYAKLDREAAPRPPS
jgi:transposase InsO family protein